MSGRKDDALTPEQAQVRAAVRDLGVPEASAAFRARLKREFMAGSIAATGLDTGEGAMDDSLPRPDGLRTGSRRPDGRRRAWRLWISLPIAAGALAVLVLLIGLVNRGPAWELRAAVPGSRLFVDGEPVPLDGIAMVSARLRPGQRLALARDDSVMVDVISPGTLIVQLIPGTEMILPHPPGRWFGREVRARVESGEARFTTRERFAGARLWVDLPGAMVEVVGTTLAVIRLEGANCVCVYEGTVRFGPDTARLEPVREGTRKILYLDDRPAVVEDLPPMETMKLQMLRDTR